MTAASDILSFKNIALRYGLPFGLVFIILHLLLYLLGIDKEQYSMLITAAVMILMSIYSISDARKLNGGAISFKEGFKAAFLSLLIAILIGTLYFIIHTNFIDTTYYQAMAELQMEAMRKKGYDEGTIAKAMEMSKQFMSPGFVIAMATLAQLLMNLIISSISAVIMKRP